MGDAARFYKLHHVSFSPKWFGLFRLLIEQPHRSIGEAASQLGLTHPAISQMAKELSKEGLLTSKTDAKDERRRTIELTKRGRDLAAKMEPIWSAIDEASRELSEDAGLDIISKLEKLEQAMRERPMIDRIQARYLSRGLRLADLDAKTRDKFRTLNLAWLEKNFTLEPIDEKVLKNPEHEIVAKGGSVIMALMDNEAVGTVAVKPLNDSRWELLKLAVDPKHRGKGIGERLTREAMIRARKRGARTLYLETSRILEPAVRLYQKLGFKEIERPAETETQRCDLCMEIKLGK
jgi:ribosomal protein S18 acetylase RimI-like enzyme/predicted transcriptional regulator